jgi:hypothetical protein
VSDVFSVGMLVLSYLVAGVIVAGVVGRCTDLGREPRFVIGVVGLVWPFIVGALVLLGVAYLIGWATALGDES